MLQVASQLSVSRANYKSSKPLFPTGSQAGCLFIPFYEDFLRRANLLILIDIWDNLPLSGARDKRNVDTRG